MTEVEAYQEPQPPVLHESALLAWARDASEAYRIAESLVKTSFVPASMKDKPGEATAAILTGQEIGLRPMAALRSIDLIQGVPAMRANAIRGLVQARGHEVWVEETSDTRAVVAGQRHGTEREQKSVWTIERATRLGLTSKQNWKTQPGAMLVARATAEVCRLIASDVLLGMPYAVEELDEIQAAPAKKARRAPVDAPVAAEPSLPVSESAEPVPVAEATEEPPLDWPEVAS